MSLEDFTGPELTAARNLVGALRLPPGMSPVCAVSNPATHTHFAYLQAVAVETTDVTPTVDGTLPDSAWLDGAAPQVEAFRVAFELPGLPELLEGGSKRQKTTAAPRLKVTVPASGDAAAVLALYHAGTLGSLTIPNLKEIAKERGVPVGGKKDELLARIHDSISQSLTEDANHAANAAAAARAALSAE